MSLVSPDNTSDGQLMKKWKIADGKRILMKGSSKPYYQEALCQLLPTLKGSGLAKGSVTR